MKKISMLFMAFLPLLTFAQERIMVIADPHVLAQSLIEEGEAFESMMDNQRKMLDLSEPAWWALIDTALTYKPELVLIPGDLTKDSEKASHEVVVAGLERLHKAGIKTLVIPGNHDIGGNAYAYKGDQKIEVEHLSDEEWESRYAWVYNNAVAKDPDSHSYVSEPFSGVTVLAIDGTNNDASVGSLSENTLSWVLAQADSAKSHGNLIIAMAHWQLMDHFDMQGRVESACQFENAAAIRDSLAHHGVHLVLTGHFHINSITTYRDTLSAELDSLVEISTGSPITYPCPYRWLTISQDRHSVTVETDNLMALATRPDLLPYSREWMRIHAEKMLPQLALRAWNKVGDKAFDKAEEIFGPVIATILKGAIPQDDAGKIDLVQRHLGSTIVGLYLLHSDANEPDQAEAESLAQAFYAGIESMIRETMDNSMAKNVPGLTDLLISVCVGYAHDPIQSMVEDVTNWTSVNYNDRTDDLRIVLTVNTPGDTPIENIWENASDATVYDLMGRPVSDPSSTGEIYLQKGRKFMIR